MRNEADQIIDQLAMMPLIGEGGYFVQKYKSNTVLNIATETGALNKRASATVIYYLLKADQISALHRLKSDEIWHYYGGDPITLVMLTKSGAKEILIGSDILGDQLPQYVVMRETWFGAYIKAEHNKKGYSLLGCTVSPGFEYDDLALGDRTQLLDAYPSCHDVIMKLTPSFRR